MRKHGSSLERSGFEGIEIIDADGGMRDRDADIRKSMVEPSVGLREHLDKWLFWPIYDEFGRASTRRCLWHNSRGGPAGESVSTPFYSALPLDGHWKLC